MNSFNVELHHRDYDIYGDESWISPIDIFYSNRPYFEVNNRKVCVPTEVVGLNRIPNRFVLSKPIAIKRTSTGEFTVVPSTHTSSALLRVRYPLPTKKRIKSEMTYQAASDSVLLDENGAILLILQKNEEIRLRYTVYKKPLLQGNWIEKRTSEVMLHWDGNRVSVYKPSHHVSDDSLWQSKRIESLPVDPTLKALEESKAQAQAEVAKINAAENLQKLGDAIVAMGSDIKNAHFKEAINRALDGCTDAAERLQWSLAEFNTLKTVERTMTWLWDTIDNQNDGTVEALMNSAALDGIRTNLIASLNEAIERTEYPQYRIQNEVPLPPLG